ncbi:phosphatidate cytidylyltransferase [Gregarina niphandrodes]|uniref:Phosphatidate cytidylyltransferase n=1 Tax=Gregarina niphandrodes TaxID=110365 RepID=A0A023AZD7_GRENI|nr:phosphatidate cytidylyltransferase [Gregarina niphandrodes]EZG44095.1 phosphatidate cytidylyltransferase [Gregarina niphandrodes]|eukprot:XP_011132806.1 phosphatidate cytidylyltransferase [Gregarina niphandrodes]
MGLVAVGGTLEYFSLREMIFKATKPATARFDRLMVAVVLMTCFFAVMSELQEESQSFKSARVWVLAMKVTQFIIAPLCTLILPLVSCNLDLDPTAQDDTAPAARAKSIDPHILIPYVTRWLSDWGFINLVASTLTGMVRIRKSVDPHGAAIGISKMVFVIMTPWVGDAGALLIGGKLGRCRVIPAISPNKTLEGYCGLVVFALLSTFGMRYIGWWLYPQHQFNLFQRTANPLFLAVVSVISAFASAVGDLIESTLKRIAGVKDTSNLFGPHGGILDKVDSIMILTVCLSHLIA